MIEFDTALQQLDSASGSQTSLVLEVDTPGDEQRLFSMARSSTSAFGFTCFWFSPVSYLALDRPTGFYVTDESGADWPGDDEISLDVFVDGTALFQGGWDDADTGERWPGLAEAIRTRLTAVLPGAARVPFVSDITLSYAEEDISASGSLVEIIRPLVPTDPDVVNRPVALPIPDTISDGTYTFYGTISRLAERLRDWNRFSWRLVVSGTSCDLFATPRPPRRSVRGRRTLTTGHADDDATASDRTRDLWPHQRKRGDSGNGWRTDGISFEPPEFHLRVVTLD